MSSLVFSKAKDAEIAWIDSMTDLSKAKTDTSARYEPEEGEVKEEKGEVMERSERSEKCKIDDL